MTMDKVIRIRYILLTMEELSVNYVSENSLYKRCLERQSGLVYPSALGFRSSHINMVD